VSMIRYTPSAVWEMGRTSSAMAVQEHGVQEGGGGAGWHAWRSVEKRCDVALGKLVPRGAGAQPCAWSCADLAIAASRRELCIAI
jgi:hypothetical protein